MSALTALPSLSTGAVDLSAKEKPTKIHQAAQQFESLLIGEMLKSAHPSDSEGWLGSGESTGDDSAMDMAESQLANSLASSGGLGLAKMVERMMNAKPSQNVAETAPVNSTSLPLKK